MSTKINLLDNATVKSLTKPVRYADGGNLFLEVYESGRQRCSRFAAHCLRMVVLSAVLGLAVAWNIGGVAFGLDESTALQIHVVQFGRCLDRGTSGTNGTKIQLRDCGPGQNQKWLWKACSSVGSPVCVGNSSTDRPPLSGPAGMLV
jgi:hypothetical protein